jgi:hypothetical protein
VFYYCADNSRMRQGLDREVEEVSRTSENYRGSPPNDHLHPTNTCIQRTPSPKLTHRILSTIIQPNQRLRDQYFSIVFRINIRTI